MDALFSVKQQEMLHFVNVLAIYSYSWSIFRGTVSRVDDEKFICLVKYLQNEYAFNCYINGLH